MVYTDSELSLTSVSEAKMAVFPPLAIVGMTMRLSDAITSAEEFWDLLINKKDARTHVPANRYNI